MTTEGKVRGPASLLVCGVVLNGIAGCGETELRDASSDTSSGRPRVADESMDHFRLRLDRALMLEVLALDEASPPAPDSATMDLWFDGEGISAGMTSISV